MNPGGLPHSEISGSKFVCNSPELIAACHVLHRLFVPSHPPSALGSLITENSSASLTLDKQLKNEAILHGGVT